MSKRETRQTDGGKTVKPPAASTALRRLLLVGLSVAVSLVAAELAVRAFNLFSAERHASFAHARTTAAAPGVEQRFRLHPYLGYTGNPDYSGWLIDDVSLSRIFPSGVSAYYQRNNRVNVHGFPSEYADYTRERDGFNIGIFGGSVAEQLATVGGEALAAEVERLSPELRGRVRILNGALGGYKQPQQLIALMLMVMQSVRFDAVVNLDGFNQVALSASDAAAPYSPLFPSRLHYLPILELERGTATPDRIERYADVVASRRRADNWRGFADTWVGHSALVRALAGRVVLSLESNATRIEQDLQRGAAPSSIVRAADANCLLEPNDGCWDLIGDVWEESSLEMAAIAKRIGARYVHALQPNQYDDNSKPLSEAERRIAYDPSGDWPAGVKRGYPLLRARIPGMAAHGVQVLDLTQVFKGTTDDIYIDTCCHYNLRGTTMVAKAIAAALTQRHGDTETQGRK